MEFEVKLVGGIENCYVSLPLALIQTLHSSAPSLPPVLALELRSSSNDERWNVAWSGATSASPAIEVAQQFGECLSLPDRSRVQVRALLNVAKATLVTIEPSTEDDWEVMELNSELAEAAILNQVRIVHEAMKFPLWLHGRTTITFLVVSTFPKKAVVQLVPGTEVAVAPKRRKNINSNGDSSMVSSKGGHHISKALLRVQDADRGLVHQYKAKSVELGVVLTSVAIIHPETAKMFSLQSLQCMFFLDQEHVKQISKTYTGKERA
ncbi:hypothetical protein M0R45_013956 [Rubus argutus]|uniref:Peroxisomal ATPase PEX1 N-terminal C-lobe domain-containing protein n=1 Tax=Rubus argutus TaxID=59490 RepID=A0AAW1XKU5_RUBAR